MRTFRARVLVASLGIMLASCGGSTDGDTTPGSVPDASAGIGGGAGASGAAGSSGGVSGVAGSGSAGSSGAADAGKTLAVCGATLCPPLVNISGVEINECCTDDAQCGAQLGFVGPVCLELNQPGILDPQCPSQSFEGFALPGCCRPDGHCGVMDNVVGLGCVDPSPLVGIDYCCVEPGGPDGCYTCKQILEYSDCGLPSKLCGWNANQPPSGTRSAAKFFDVLGCMCDPAKCETACTPSVCADQDFPSPECKTCYEAQCTTEVAACNNDDGT